LVYSSASAANRMLCLIADDATAQNVHGCLCAPEGEEEAVIIKSAMTVLGTGFSEKNLIDLRLSIKVLKSLAFDKTSSSEGAL
jgi:hypothetical protein